MQFVLLQTARTNILDARYAPVILPLLLVPCIKELDYLSRVDFISYVLYTTTSNRTIRYPKGRYVQQT